MADLPTNPNNREEQYLASISGQDVETPACPYSRKEAYLEAIDERVESLQEELETLENNPDVVDIVDTYADLQAYDTSKLTDKDIIRVLNDETHDGNSTYYRYDKDSTSSFPFDYIGSSKTYDVFTGTDGTTAGQAGLVPAPATTDAGKFLKADGTWDDAGSAINVVQTTGTSTTDVMSQGASRALIYADEWRSSYWAHSPNKIRIGHYFGQPGSGQGDLSVIIGSNGTATGQFAVHLGSGGGTSSGNNAVAFQAGKADGSYSVAFDGGQTSTKGVFTIGLDQNYAQTYGYNNSAYRLLTGVYDGQSAHDAATYGQVISYSAINGAGAPTTATEGKYVGQLYYDTTNEAMYFLKTIDTTTTPATYTWETLGGGSSVNVVQTTGTSTTDVMSQNAVTKMVFPNSNLNPIQINGNPQKPSVVNGSIQIGYSGNSTGQGGIALGFAADAGLAGSISLGSYSRASSIGEMNIGSTQTSNGYNSSNYRLLTGVYDGQSAHDAATVGQLPATLTNTQFNAIIAGA